MQTQSVKFSEWIQGGLNLYKENFGILFTASLIALLLSSVTLGILAGPLAVGVAAIVLRLIDKQDPKPEIGDVFKGFDRFLPSFLLFLGVGLASLIGSTILGIVPIFGTLLGLLFSYGLQTAVMFSIFLITERKMDIVPAVTTSFDTVKKNFWPFLGLYVVACLLSSIGLILCGIGVILTAPILACIVGVTYRNVFSAQETPETGSEPGPGSDEPQAAASEPPPSPAGGETTDGTPPPSTGEGEKA